MAEYGTGWVCDRCWSDWREKNPDRMLEEKLPGPIAFPHRSCVICEGIIQSAGSGHSVTTETAEKMRGQEAKLEVTPPPLWERGCSRCGKKLWNSPYTVTPVQIAIGVAIVMTECQECRPLPTLKNPEKGSDPA